MSTNIFIKKKVYEAKKARDILDEEFVEFIPKTRSINEFFNVYSKKFYILEKETHAYFIQKSLEYIQTWTHPKEIMLHNIQEETGEVQFEIDSVERSHPIIPNGVVIGVPTGTPEHEDETEWANINQCDLYYIQSGKKREIGRYNHRQEMFKLLKNVLRKTEMLNKEFIIQVPSSLISTIELGPPLLNEGDLNESVYTINKYQNGG